MTDEVQVEHMVNRFLQWKLPADFAPDAGISFKPSYNDHLDPPMRHEPVGTNLLTATQAEQMIRHLLEGLPEAATLQRQDERVRELEAALRAVRAPWGGSYSEHKQHIKQIVRNALKDTTHE